MERGSDVARWREEVRLQWQKGYRRGFVDIHAHIYFQLQFAYFHYLLFRTSYAHCWGNLFSVGKQLHHYSVSQQFFIICWTAGLKGTTTQFLVWLCATACTFPVLIGWLNRRFFNVIIINITCNNYYPLSFFICKMRVCSKLN